MKEIAIVKFVDYEMGYDDYGNNTATIASSITEWDEVTDEEYDTLLKASNTQKYGSKDRWIVLERVYAKDFVPNTIQAYLERAAKVIADEEERKLKAQEAALARKIKKQAKTEAERKKLFEELKKEFA